MKWAALIAAWILVVACDSGEDARAIWEACEEHVVAMTEDGTFDVDGDVVSKGDLVPELTRRFQASEACDDAFVVGRNDATYEEAKFMMDALQEAGVRSIVIGSSDAGE